MNIAEFDTSRRYKAEVVSTTRITPEEGDIEVRHIILALPPNTPQYSEGQSIGVLVEGPHEFGNETHLRLYSVASAREGDDGRGTTLAICVRRCFYIDEVSGERYPGVASNYLCDRMTGDVITITGPYGMHFSVPRDPSCNLLMIGVGTGIAPFRAFVKHIYDERSEWKGQVRLFYGARTGTEMLYMNEEMNDFGNYIDRKTFQAFKALSPRPSVDAPVEMGKTISENLDEIWQLIQDPRTHVYVSGQERLREQLDTVLAGPAGGEDKWRDTKAALVEDHRWSEMFY